MRTLSLAICFATATSAGPASAQTVRSRPIDQATVRLLAIAGTEPVAGRVGTQSRVVYSPRLSHGSGVLIEPHLVATAAHVVEDMDLLLVRAVGDQTMRGAIPVAIDRTNDVGLVQVEPIDAPTFAIPNEPPELVPGEMMHITGYPVDPTENNPAAASGSLSRQTNSGALELAVSLNPGNSGGPVLNEAGILIGIVSARGRMDRGIQGIAVAVPISHVASLRARTVEAESVPTVPEDIEWVFNDEVEITDASVLETPLFAALAAHRDWRRVVAKLVEFNAASPFALPPDIQREVSVHQQRAQIALGSAFRDSDIVVRYHLRELEAQLNAFDPSSATSFSASYNAALTSQSGPPTEAAAGQGQWATTPQSPEQASTLPHRYTDYGRFTLNMLLTVSPGQMFGTAVGLNVALYTSDLVDIVLGGTGFGGLWIDSCNNECLIPHDEFVATEPGDGFFGGLYLEAGIRFHGTRASAPFGAVTWTPTVIASPFGVQLLPASAKAAAGWTFGRFGLVLGYRFTFFGGFEAVSGGEVDVFEHTVEGGARIRF